MRWKGPSKVIQLPCSKQGHLQLHQVLRALSSLTLNVSRDRASTTSLGNLCHCLTTLIVKKNYFLISNLNLLSFHLKPFPLVQSQRRMTYCPSSLIKIVAILHCPRLFQCGLSHSGSLGALTSSTTPFLPLLRTQEPHSSCREILVRSGLLLTLVFNIPTDYPMLP